MRARLPAILIVAVVANLACVLGANGLYMVLARTMPPTTYGGWILALSPILRGLALGALAAYAAGAWALADHLPRRNATVARVAAVAFAAVVAMNIVDMAAIVLGGERLVARMWPYDTAISGVALAALCGACARRGRGATIGLAALSALMAIALIALIWQDQRDPQRLSIITLCAGLDLALAILPAIALALVRLDLDASPPALGPRGLRETGNALLARIAVILPAAPLGVVIAAAAPGSPQRLAGDTLLLAAVGVSLGLAACLARAARWTADGAPRSRLAVGAWLIAWAGMARLAAMSTLRDPDLRMMGSLRAAIPDLGWLPSAIDLAGLLFVASAITASARVLGATALADRASSIGGVLLVLMGGSIWMQTVHPEATSSWLLLSIGSMLAAAAATWSLARLARDLPISDVAHIPVAVARNA